MSRRFVRFVLAAMVGSFFVATPAGAPHYASPPAHPGFDFNPPPVPPDDDCYVETLLYMEVNLLDSMGAVVPGGGPGGSDLLTITFEEEPSDFVPGGAGRMGRGETRKRCPDQSQIDTLIDLWPAGAIAMMLYDDDFDGTFEQDPVDTMTLHYTDELATTGDIMWTNTSATLDASGEIESLVFPAGATMTIVPYGETNAADIPLPEPSGALMLGVGACALALLRRVSGRG